MEIFMRQLNWQFDQHQITTQLAGHLHSPPFWNSDTVFNFHIHLLKDKQRGARPHKGCGFLTLPTQELGSRFLQMYGEGGRHSISLGGRQIAFSLSKNPAGKTDVVETIRLQPYRDPQVIQDEERRTQEIAGERVAVQAIQFCWECRDGVLSIEAEDSPGDCFLLFDEDRRQLRIKFSPQPPISDLTFDPERILASLDAKSVYIIAIRLPTITTISAHNYLQRQAAIVLSLSEPPTYERAPEDLTSLFSTLFGGSPPKRSQLAFLPTVPGHQRVAPFASLVIRLILSPNSNLNQFHNLVRLANIRRVQDYEYQIDRRGLFSQEAMDEYNVWLRKLNWEVSYQVASIVSSWAVDAREMLDILPLVKQLVATKGKAHTSAFLRDFKSRVKVLYGSDDQDDRNVNAVRRCFEETLAEFSKAYAAPALVPTDGSLYQSLHVTVTPTAMILEGPYPERSNRVIRSYETRHQESFLRVTFAAEARLQYQTNDRELDQRAFVRERFGSLLLGGLTIAGRHFEFLAYSQSALKEHSVWFVKPFDDIRHGRVTAESIIQSLGNFDNLPFDSQLMYCPARYAARLSQAFTATDACIIEVEEIFNTRDIEVVSGGQKYCFTDGVGTISPELAREIWKHLKRTKRRARSLKGYPKAFQVRFGGSKGMLSVDYRLQGRVICLRDSMTKFDAPDSNAIEIARSFDRPTPYFLNRPLIMLMEGLGVSFDIIKHFQDIAVQHAQKAALSLERAADLLETHGLGASFRLPSVLNSLNKLGIRSLNQDKFYSKMMEFAINHVLRDLKNHARIPIPGAWTLVGVADVHDYLQPDEIYAYVKPLHEKGIYLEGDILISRSPTIHPGDIQVVRAIGQPPPGTPYAKEPLENTVVFSVKGSRPLPSYLGGGDLDGDIYNLIPLSKPNLAAFRPTIPNAAPSQYAPATRKLLERKSTMADVAEFVVEYISSDVLGIIAINWLIIADQSPQGINDEDCLKLANLHSDAVDYPKSGNPVALDKIPRLKHRLKPDWNAPETMDPERLDIRKYYKSSAYIGKLFRAIELPVEQREGSTRPRRHRRGRRGQSQRRDDEDDTHPLLGIDPYYEMIEMKVEESGISTDEPFAERLFEEAERIYSRYTTELEGICYTHTITNTRNAMLTEEEVLIGTIVQKTSQPRRRKDVMAKMREATDVLVRGIREVLEGSEEDSEEVYLQRAWFAWLLSLEKGTEFGAQSFGWVTLGAVFDAIRQIEERRRAHLLSFSI